MSTELDRIKQQTQPFEELGVRVPRSGSKSVTVKCPLPDHADTKGSCSIYVRRSSGVVAYSCKGCGSSGTIVDLYGAINGLGEEEAIRAVLERWGDGDGRTRSAARAQPVSTQISPKGTLEEGPPPTHILDSKGRKKPGIWCAGTMMRMLTVDDAASVHVQWAMYGEHLKGFGVIRWNDVLTRAGKHEGTGETEAKVIRQIWCDGETWHSSGKPEELRYPFYKLEQIEAVRENTRDTVVVIVEGEKTMDALSQAVDEANFAGLDDRLGRLLVTSPIGGADGVEQHDVGPLVGLHVVIWPDHDGQGYEMARTIWERLGRTSKLWLFDPYREDWGDVGGLNEARWGLDAADALNDGFNVLELLNKECLHRASELFEEEEGEREGAGFEALVARASRFTSQVSDDELDELLTAALMLSPSPRQMHQLEEALSNVAPVGVIRAQIKHIEESFERIDPADLVATRTIESWGQDRLLFSEGMWWAYTGTHWEPVSGERIQQDILKIARQSVSGSRRLMQVVSDAARLVSIEVSDESAAERFVRQPEPRINCINGELVLSGESLRLEPHSPASMHFSCVQARYITSPKPKLFLQTLSEICEPFGDEAPQMMAYLCESFGYWLSPYKPLKAFWLFTGPGDNGKSMLIKLIGALAGQGAYLNTKIERMNERFGLQSIPGRLMVVNDDMEDGELPGALLKQLGTQVALSVERKGKTPFDVINTASPIIASNHKPYTSDMTPALASRAHVIFLPRQFPEGTPECDPDRSRKIIELERDDAFSLLASHAKDVLDRGYFDLPNAVIEERKKWIAMSNPIQLFLSECVVAGGPEDRVTGKTLSKMCRLWWTNHQSLPTKPPSMSALGRAIEESGGFDYATTSARDGGWYIAGAKVETEMVQLLGLFG